MVSSSDTDLERISDTVNLSSMSLYDDDDDSTHTPEPGWASGIKHLIQPQLQLLKAAVTQPKREAARKAALAPVMDFKSKKLDFPPPSSAAAAAIPQSPFHQKQEDAEMNCEDEWDKWDDLYNPLWPNEYDVIVKEMKAMKGRHNDRDEEDSWRKRRGGGDRNHYHKNSKKRENDDKRNKLYKPSSDSEEEGEKEKPSRGGVAIAPPSAILQDAAIEPAPKPPSGGGNYGSSVAAKIMARYGFKEGQGLGKKEQGISAALQVEKTSKRGGRIVLEKDLMPPPPMFGGAKKAAALLKSFELRNNETEQHQSPPPLAPAPEIQSNADLVKAASKVVLLKNMVGPGEVDDDLEGEIREELNSKYGELVNVLIYEIPGAEDSEAVRIFAEFKRVEPAIKALLGLQGRFFGGRTVRANFYDYDKYSTYQLMD